MQQVLRISYKDLVTSEKVFQDPAGNQLTIKRCKLKQYGHVFHTSGLVKTIMEGKVKGEENKVDRKRGGKTRDWQAWSSPSPRGQWRIQKTGCEVICGAPMTPTVKDRWTRGEEAEGPQFDYALALLSLVRSFELWKLANLWPCPQQLMKHIIGSLYCRLL